MKQGITIVCSFYHTYARVIMTNVSLRKSAAQIVLVELQVTITFSELGLKSGAPMTVEDIWTGKTHAKTATSEFVTDSVGGHDSRFYLLKPTAGN